MAISENAELAELIRRATNPDNSPAASAAPTPLGQGDDDDDSINLDLATLMLVARRSMLWLLLLIGLGIAASWLYLRYTKPIFRSLSTLKIDERTEASALGLAALAVSEKMSGSKLAGEVEIIKSALIYRRLKDSLALDVNYYAQGTVLETELYGVSPFRVKYVITDNSYYNRNFNLEFVSAHKFKLTFTGRNRSLGGTYRLDEPISLPGIELKISSTPISGPGCV